MFDYRLFFPGSTLDDRTASRRRVPPGHGGQQRVYRLPSGRRAEREARR